jgi:hypothetical protein
VKESSGRPRGQSGPGQARSTQGLPESRGERNHLLSMTDLLPFFTFPILAPRRGRFVVTAIPGVRHGAALADAPLGWTSSMGDVPAALLPLLSLVGANPR